MFVSHLHGDHFGGRGGAARLSEQRIQAAGFDAWVQRSCEIDICTETQNG